MQKMVCILYFPINNNVNHTITSINYNSNCSQFVTSQKRYKNIIQPQLNVCTVHLKHKCLRESTVGSSLAHSGELFRSVFITNAIAHLH